jgi:hypothetical protein
MRMTSDYALLMAGTPSADTTKAPAAKLKTCRRLRLNWSIVFFPHDSLRFLMPERHASAAHL